MVKQPTFEGFKKPKKRRRVMMSPVDRGCENNAYLVCSKCQHDAGWWYELTPREMRYGLPCPKCNAAAPSIPAMSESATTGIGDVGRHRAPSKLTRSDSDIVNSSEVRSA